MSRTRLITEGVVGKLKSVGANMARCLTPGLRPHAGLGDGF